MRNMDAGPDKEAPTSSLKGLISPVVKSVMSECYSIWAIPLGIVLLFLLLHAVEMYTLVKLLRCKPAN